MVTEKGLFFGLVPSSDVLKGTKPPFFVTVLDRVKENCRAFTVPARDVFPDAPIFYSVKTNTQPFVLKVIAIAGLGAQVVSPREFFMAVDAGFPADKIIVDGIFRDETSYDLVKDHDGLLFIESWTSNVSKLQQACERFGRKARLGLRFKFPKKDNRLGFSLADEDAMNALGAAIGSGDRVRPVMLACHPGSQVQDPHDHVVACKTLLDAHDYLEQRQGMPFPKPVLLNLGGGFAEPEMATPARLAGTMHAIKDTMTANHSLKDFAVCFEPGRYIVGDASAIVSTMVETFRDDAGARWALLDVGMDVLTRFANSHYRFFSMEHPDAPHGTPISFQGRVPTEQDVFGKGVHFIKDAKAGEHVLLMNCGAYSTTFSMRFSFEQPRCVVVDGDAYSVHELTVP